MPDPASASHWLSPRRHGALLKVYSVVFQSGFSSGAQVRANVKWFNPTKGFGFVTPEDGSPDAFLHVSALRQAGFESVPEGAAVVCEIGRGPKGPQVVRVLEVGEAPDTFAVSQADATVTISGSVKWFKPEKGFGFVRADDGGKDVFVHKSVLRRCGLQTLEDGRRVTMSVEAGAKGREATWISVE
jgi:CspA family cold shock protein